MNEDNQPLTPETTPTNKPDKTTKILVIVFIIILVAVIGELFYYFVILKNKSSGGLNLTNIPRQNQNQSQNLNQIQTNTINPTITVNPTTGLVAKYPSIVTEDAIREIRSFRKGLTSSLKLNGEYIGTIKELSIGPGTIPTAYGPSNYELAITIEKDGFSEAVLIRQTHLPILYINKGNNEFVKFQNHKDFEIFTIGSQIKISYRYDLTKDYTEQTKLLERVELSKIQ